VAGLVGELLHAEALVGLHHDLERFAHRRRAVVLLDRLLGALRCGHPGAALHVVARDVELVVGEAVAQVDHAAARVVRVFALRVILDDLAEGGEGLARGLRRARVQVDLEPALEDVRRALEFDQALDVPGVVDARMGRVLADEGVGGVQRGFGLAALLVVGVDQVEARLARFGREREAGVQRLVEADRVVRSPAVRLLWARS
jgi:hypothetical protein